MYKLEESCKMLFSEIPVVRKGRMILQGALPTTIDPFGSHVQISDFDSKVKFCERIDGDFFYSKFLERTE